MQYESFVELVTSFVFKINIFLNTIAASERNAEFKQLKRSVVFIYTTSQFKRLNKHTPMYLTQIIAIILLDDGGDSISHALR